MSPLPLPGDIFLDTSIVIGAMFPGTPDSLACSNLCQDLVSGRSHIYFAQVLRLDLARALRRLATKPDKLPMSLRAEYQLDLWGANPLVRQRWLSRGARRLEDFLGQFVETVEIPLTNDLWRRGLVTMAVEGLDATDAIHLSAARQIGIADFATTDRDFRQIGDPFIHLIRDADTT